MKQIYTILCVCFLSLGQAYGQLNFDGINDGINLSFNALLPIWNSPRTIEARIRTTSSSGGGAILTLGNPIFSNGRFALYETGGNLNFVGENNDFNTNRPINDGVWHHVAATFDGAILKIYLDGALVGSKSTNFDTMPLEFSIGYRGAYNPSEYFNGDIEEVRVWNVARTQAQINDFKNNRLILPQTGLISYYKFNQGIPNGANLSETTLRDELGANNGTLVNFALIGNSSNWIGGSSFLSVVTAKDNLALKVLPNPATSQINITGLKQKENFVIFDSTGKVVKTGFVSSDDKIEVSNLSKGVYFVKIKNNNLKFLKL